MLQLSAINDRFSLDALAEQITASSNFRFAWHFYAVHGSELLSHNAIRAAFEHLVWDPSLHGFLKNSFDPMYDKAFRIDTLHEHCRIVPAPTRFEATLASAANDTLGAYSRIQRNSNRGHAEIARLFESCGDYSAFELLPGQAQDCSVCSHHNNHLFTNWFYGVAWDWCFIVTWPQTKLVWLGCLTDTD